MNFWKFLNLMRYFCLNIFLPRKFVAILTQNILFFIHNIFRDPPMTKLKIFPHLELVMP